MPVLPRDGAMHGCHGCKMIQFRRSEHELHRRHVGAAPLQHHGSQPGIPSLFTLQLHTCHRHVELSTPINSPLCAAAAATPDDPRRPLHLPLMPPAASAGCYCRIALGGPVAPTKCGVDNVKGENGDAWCAAWYHASAGGVYKCK